MAQTIVTPVRGPVATRACPGFTLIELIVVVLLIAIVVGMLVPAVGRAREQVRTAVCAAHLREIGAGVAIYANAYRDQVPFLYDQAGVDSGLITATKGYHNLGAWYVLLGDVLGWARAPRAGGGFYTNRTDLHAPTVIHCPSEPHYATATDPPWLLQSRANGPDWAIGHFGAATPSSNLTVGNVVTPAEKVFLVDTPRGMGQWYHGARFPVDRWPYEVTRMRHNDGINNLFFDGHAGYLDKQAFDARGINAFEPTKY